MLQTFDQMWDEFLKELVYGILNHPTIESVYSVNHWNLVVCEDVPAGCDPQGLVSLRSYQIKTIIKLVKLEATLYGHIAAHYNLLFVYLGHNY